MTADDEVQQIANEAAARGFESATRMIAKAARRLAETAPGMETATGRAALLAFANAIDGTNSDFFKNLGVTDED